MKTMVLVLATVALSAGAALAQFGVNACPTGTCPPVASPAAICPQPACPQPPVAACPAPVCPTAVCPTTPACPTGCPTSTSVPLPGLCAARIARNITGNDVIQVLGYEESFALDNLPGVPVNYRDFSLSSNSIVDDYSPLLSYQPNAAVTRHGNPYFPYSALSPQCRVACPPIARGIPANLDVCDQGVLLSVRDQYCNLTRENAVCLGYQPIGACIDGIGTVYLNAGLVDNVFDPMQPEAFTYDDRGQLLAAHYIVTSSQQVTGFGQNFMPSPLVPEAQQLAAWIFTPNPDGLFCLSAPRIRCAGTQETLCPCPPPCPRSCPQPCPQPCPPRNVCPTNTCPTRPPSL